MINGSVSFWQAALGPPPARPSLDGSMDADVCIVGAGYTGLWTAWGLAVADPRLRVVVVESEHAGFGASGRNGGWLSGLMPGNRDHLARESAGGPGGGRPGVIALQRHLVAAVAEVVKVCAEEGIDADIHLGGTLAAATSAAQMGRLRAGVHEDRAWGLGPDDEWELSGAETAQRVAVAGAAGGVYSPHCARIQPAKLVRGLADAVERRGVTIYERTLVEAVGPGWVRTSAGDVRAPWVVLATEGFTAALPGYRRRLLPMNSSMIVTEPLAAQAWDRIGWAGLETLRDGAHAYTYAQRTADGRIAIGGRGVPYRYGSRLDKAGRTPPSTATQLAAALGRLLPDAGGTGGAGGAGGAAGSLGGSSPVDVAHVWSGVLGVARDWCPAVGVTRAGAGSLAWAGGYVGDGVTTAYLAGSTLADLILGRDTSRTALPWVGHTSPKWEPEPLRWLGVRSVYALYRAADRAEGRHPTRPGPSGWAKVADRISGRP